VCKSENRRTVPLPPYLSIYLSIFLSICIACAAAAAAAATAAAYIRGVRLGVWGVVRFVCVCVGVGGLFSVGVCVCCDLLIFLKERVMYH